MYGVQPGEVGSPPRMRGKLPAILVHFCLPGITPADAGKTISAMNRSHLPQDHPRGCGENAVRNKRCVPAIGSPPQVRGKLE